MKNKRFVIHTEIDKRYLTNKDLFLKALEQELKSIKKDAIEFYNKNYD